MIQFFLSLKMRRSSCARGKRPVANSLHIERLESRYVFAAPPPVILENWQSAIFDDGVTGTLPFAFSRGVESVEPDGERVQSFEPRFGNAQMLSEIDTWNAVLPFTERAQIFGSGWDHDGTTPLAMVWDVTTRQLTFIRGENFEVANVVNLPGNLDLFMGEVPGFRYIPQSGIIYEGLIVVMLERERREGANWVTEGVAFAYTQDYGQSFQRVEQVGGGFDVPAIANGAADGIGRSRPWSFANAFPEKSANDRLGAWFPWADYLDKTDLPKGGQIGVFRARRAAVGEQWVVEPNRLVYEDWRAADFGGLHAHTAGMFVDGMVSFWGDVGYRNHMVRHVAADLENYTTTTWTHEEEFQGGWSPSDNQVYLLGNQALSAAPGANFGEVLVVGDEQPELIMKVERPANVGEKAVITDLRGSFPGVYQGSGFAGRFSPFMHTLRGKGYVVTEQSTSVPGTNGLFYSADGVHWAELLNTNGIAFLYGNRIVANNEGTLYALPVPTETSVANPLLLNPGGQNLATADPVVVGQPATGNTARRVIYADGLYKYQDTLEPLDVQPPGPPPVGGGMPMWEFTATELNRNMGAWELGNILSESSKLHWLSAWHYSLDGNGIAPSVRIGDVSNTERESAWVANDHWVPTMNFGVPNGVGQTDEQRFRMMNGTNAGPRRWLTAIEGYNQGPAPTYPLPPGRAGNNELAAVNLVGTTTKWSAALTFGLSQVSSFSTQFDPAGAGTVHTLASIYRTNNDHIDVTFARTDSAQGVISIDVYSSNVLLDRLSFKNIYFDREDQIRMVISNSPEEFGVTLLVTRNGYGMDSKSIVGSSVAFVPNQIRLSNATRTIVEPMEWYAIQFSPTQALTTAEREIMVGLSYMFERLDAPPVIGPPGFDADDDIDGRDFLIWQRGFGITEWAVREDGDANVDGRVDEADLAVWQLGYGLGGQIDPPSADFNQDETVDGADLEAWQAGYGITGKAGAHDQGDADFDGAVNGRDFMLWQRQFNGAEIEEPAESITVDSEPATTPAAAEIGVKSMVVATQESDFAAPRQADNDRPPPGSWLPAAPIATVEVDDAWLDDNPLQELVLLKKYVVASELIYSDELADGALELPEADDEETVALSDWDISADLAIERWHAF